MVVLLQRLTFEQRKSKQNALAPALGASLWLGMPDRRHRGLTGRLKSKTERGGLVADLIFEACALWLLHPYSLTKSAVF